MWRKSHLGYGFAGLSQYQLRERDDRQINSAIWEASRRPKGRSREVRAQKATALSLDILAIHRGKIFGAQRITNDQDVRQPDRGSSRAAI